MAKAMRHVGGMSGDKSELSGDERYKLEKDILPAARRWLGIPMLDEHGAKTLAYWGETFELPTRLNRIGWKP